MASREKIRRGFLSDLNPDFQSKIMKINKIISDTTRSIAKDDKFKDLNDSRWAMSCIDEFCVAPTGKSDVGSVRVYKSKDTYRCEIQVTGRFKNYDYGYIEELLDGLMKNVIISARPKIRREFDMTLRNNGDKTSPDEGFDVILSNKESKEIWDSFENKKTKSITEETELVNSTEDLINYYEFYADSGISYDQYFYEKSHGKLKFDFRAGINIKDGHPLKIVYGLSNMKFEDDIRKGWGDQSYFDLYKYNDDKIKNDKDRENHIKRVGNTDHMTSGQKILAIIDLTTNKRLKGEVECIGVFNAEEIKHIGVNDGKQAKEYARKHGKTIFKIKEGDNENQSSFKSTVWSKDIDARIKALSKSKNEEIKKHRIIDILSNDISPREETPNRRGFNAMDETIPDLKFSDMEKAKSYFKKRYKDLDDKLADELFMKITCETSDDYDYKSVFDDILDEIPKKYGNDKKRDTAVSVINKIRRELPTLRNFKVSIIGSYRKHLNESANNTPEYNVDMSEKQAKATLRTLSQSIINDVANKKGYKVTQYTANIYANIITKNLLPIWAKGFRKFSITLDSYQSFATFEFKVPKMTQDFVSRFVDGKESINGFIHREPEIKVKMSPRIFHTMKNADDAFTFFKLAIQYYDSKLDKMSVSLMSEVRKLGYGMKHLIKTTKLSGLVTYPISLLFVFDDVDMSNKDTFRISKEDIATVNRFIRGISTNYAAPEKEKSKIIEDVKKMVETLHESCEFKDNTSDTRYLPEAIQKYYNGEYSDLLKEAENNFITENTDIDWERGQTNYQLKYYQEKLGVKKLKKIPADIVAYITIEAESIRDANDKMMISSYCLSKLEIVEWYIELLIVGSKKYVVPHTKPYLENLRTQLLACFKKIMDIPVPKPGSNRPIIDIQYPKGYEG